MNRRAVWINYSDLLNGIMPKSNWVCMATSSNSHPDEDTFDKFTRKTIENGLLEFKGHGNFGEKLHDWFDQTIMVMHAMENPGAIEVMTTWHNGESLADVFWQCFGATCLPDTADYDNIIVVITDLDNENRMSELKGYMTKFQNGWIPE